MARVLIVDPDSASSQVLSDILATNEHTSRRVTAANDGLHALQTELFDLVIAELDLPGEGGLALLAQVNERWPGVPVILLATESSISRAVEAMRAGAADFVPKPLDSGEILFLSERALAGAAAAAAKPPVVEPKSESPIVGHSEVMREVDEVLRRAAPGQATVLIRGESGTGKELLARAVHQQSSRSAGPFLKIDCTSLPDTLFESELFGYEKGAFTGAHTRKLGRIELADGGTVFLDEIGELSGNMQAKLLRLLQDREFERLGGKQTIHVDVRFILATHRDLETMVKNGTFRLDLFYRLNVVPIWLPPLRSRREDIELLANHFCQKFGRANGRPSLRLSPAALRFLRSQRWPGNVRQLENFMERLVVLAEGPAIEQVDVEREFVQRPQFTTQSTESTSLESSEPPLSSPLVLSEAVRKAECNALIKALKRTGGNRSVAARVLGVSRATLYNKLREYALDEESPSGASS